MEATRAGRRWAGAVVLGLVAALALSACSPSSTPAGPKREAKAGTGVGVLLDEPALQLHAAACPEGDRCLAVGSGATPAWSQAAAGAAWRRATLPAEPADLLDVSCAGPRDCLAVGANRSFTSPAPVAWRSRDAGASWVAARAPAREGTLQRVSCSAGRCVAVGIDATGTWTATTADLGRSWQDGAGLPAAFTAVGDLACVEAACVAVGIGPGAGTTSVGLVAESSDRGRSWELVLGPGDGLGPLFAVSCPNLRWCQAVGSTGQGTDLAIVRATGSTRGGWSATKPLQGWRDLDAGYAIWCGSDPTCTTGGVSLEGEPAAPIGAIAVPSRRGRDLLELAYPPASVVAIACAPTKRCVAVGGRTAVAFAPPGA